MWIDMMSEVCSQVKQVKQGQVELGLKQQAASITPSLVRLSPWDTPRLSADSSH